MITNSNNITSNTADSTGSTQAVLLVLPASFIISFPNKNVDSTS